jgi:hypothetical protein
MKRAAGGRFVASVLATVVVGCGSSASSTAAGSTPHTTAAPGASATPAPAGPWSEQLTFSGGLTGTATAGMHDNTAVCSGTQSIPKHFLEVHFDVVLGGTTYQLVLHARYVAGPGATQIDGENVQTTLTSTDYSPPGPPPVVPGQTPTPQTGSQFAAVSGTLTIAASGDSGSVDASMGSASDFTGTAPRVQLSGSWTCRTLPPPTGSSPEGLTFSGDINGQMTSATPDPATGTMPARCTLPGPGTQSRGIAITGDVQGSRWNLLVLLGSNSLAAGTYSGNGGQIYVELNPGTGNSVSGSWLTNEKALDSDTLTINPGVTSGTVDVIARPSLPSNSAPAFGPTHVRITGSFTCVASS